LRVFRFRIGSISLSLLAQSLESDCALVSTLYRLLMQRVCHLEILLVPSIFLVESAPQLRLESSKKIETDIWVSPAADVEVRRLTAINHSGRTQVSS
jgi:hypothetical protein